MRSLTRDWLLVTYEIGVGHSGTKRITKVLDAAEAKALARRLTARRGRILRTRPWEEGATDRARRAADGRARHGA